MITFENVSKSFGNIKALDSVSFEIGKGEFVFLAGPSGAGKTTILRLILKELTPDSGQITFGGVDITKLRSNQIPLLRQHIGVVFQDFKILPERTLKENIELALAVVGIAQNEWKARIDQVLKLVGLSERSELFPAQLSGGEIQRASMARALVVNPKLLLADEPTGNLDWETADAIMDLFEKVNKEGKTILMATHNKILIDKHKHRVIEIKEGKLVHGSKMKKT